MLTNRLTETMNKTVIRNLLTGAWALLFAFAASAFGQGVTSSNISGIVNDADGQPISGATVTLVYAPTNSTSTTTTNPVGRYSFSGLRVGGPYTVSATANGQKSNERSDINLELSQTFQADLAVGTEAEIVKMEAFITRADSNTLFDSFITGSGTDVSRVRIDAVPTIARALNEYAKLDPRIVITDRSNGETSALGQNGRYNSIMIDGVRSNDVFGLTSNGLPSQGNPISIDTIEAFNIEIAPYDVAQSGFTGAAINAVTKSGTNEYHGMVKYLWTNQRIRAKNEDPTNINYGKRETFSEDTLVATLGGPIIKDKLFFFGSYEKFSRNDPVANAGFQPTAAAIDTIVSALKAYNYDPGVLTNSGNVEKKDTKVLAKIDWNINSAQRLSVRYNKTKGTQPIFQDFSTTNAISFSNHWYVNQQIDTNYVATLFSNWTPNFKTEAKVAFSKYQTDRSPNGPAFPQIVIGSVPSAAGGTATGTVFVGWENSTQLNHLLVKNNNYTFTGTYLLDDHTVTFGVDYEYNQFYNAFAQGVLGSYGTATSLNGFNFSALSATGISGITNNYGYQYSPTGGSLAADWKFSNPALFVQDQWHVNSRLTVTAGLRLDTFTSDKPGYNAALSSYAWPTLGGQTVNNSNSFDGAKLLAPRVSFNLALDADRTTQLRGGIGVFQGKGPGVWISNNFSNNGLTIAQATKGTLAANGITQITFQPDPTKQYFSAAQPTYAVNAMQNGFKLPSALKLNLSVDRKLPWWGLIGTLSYDQTKTLENYFYQDINLNPVGTLPDGRIRYSGRVNSGYTNVFLMMNTKKGNAYNYTAELKKPYKNHWFGTFSYTYGSSKDVSPITSSTAGSNFGSRMAVNPNSEELATSNYEVKHRFSVSASRDFDLIKGFKTTVGLYYEARSGRPYSYVNGGSGTSGDVNGDTANQNNDLFYVPTGPSDPKVRWTTPAQSDAFFAWLKGVGDLQSYAGSIVPRNSATSKWIHQLDFNLRQEIPIWGNVKAELFYDIYNLTNLLNSHWGRYSQIGFPYNYFVTTGITYDAVANQYVYSFANPPRGQTLDNTLSRWQMQAGVSLKF